MTGGTAPATIHGTGLASAALTFTPAQVDFTTVDVGTPASQMVTVTNSGGVATTALTTALSGTNASDFSFTSNTCANAVLQPGQQCLAQISFKPAARGARVGSFDVGNVPGMASAPLSGTGRDYVTLGVTKNGTGGGTVSGGPISCGATCSAQVARTSTTDPIVMLTATPDATSTFTGWSGAGCSGTGQCAVTMSQAQSVIATFTRIQYTLTFTSQFQGPASAIVQSAPAGISCNGQCTNPAQFDAGSQVTLTASGTSGSLYRWTGACTGTGPTCVVTMNGPLSVTLIVNAFNYMFVTSSGISGNMGGLAGGDAKCAQLAQAAGLPGNYVAWLAT
jgi:hypothetical protein